MIKTGLYKHYRTGHLCRVIGSGRVDTQGPSEGRLAVIFIDFQYGGFHVLDEEEFRQKIEPPSGCGFSPGVQIARYTFVGEPTMSDADAESLYDGLCELAGRKPAP